MKSILLSIVRFYKSFISPLTPPSCRFHPSCSQYALDALDHFPLHVALFKITLRILRCNPFFSGGHDPVLK